MLYIYSFWGKFGQRGDLTQTKYVYNQAELLPLILDPTKKVKDFHIVNDDLIVVDYEDDEDFVADSPSANVFIATFTTCWARLKLLDVLHKVGERALYYDTDSIIYVEDSSCPDVHMGDYLGQLTDECKDGSHIIEFVSGGPKSYAYRESSGETTCKVKGFTLNYTNSHRINFESLKNIVLGGLQDKIELPASTKITRDKRKYELINREEGRTYKAVYTKRRRIDNFDTVPFGFKKDA